MKPRTLLATALLLPLCAGITTADAAVKKKPPVRKPVCNLVRDAKGDATGFGGVPNTAPNDPNTDILSVDLATNATTLTVAFRVDAMEANPTGSPTGRSFELSFAGRGGNQSLRVVLSPAGNVFPTGSTAQVVDTAKKEIRFSVAIASLTTKVKPNDKITGLRATSARYVGPTNVTLGNVDTATTNATYVSGWPSCVKVGA